MMALLGELETRVMEDLWQAGVPRSVRQVHTAIAAERDLAYTTVMTVLDRLAKKEVVRRERDGRQWLYQPMTSRAVLVADEVIELLRGTTGERRQVLQAVWQRLSAADQRWLAEQGSAG